MSAPSKPLPPERALNPELEVKPEATKPKRGLYGESDHKIAREENIDRATVARILTQPGAVAMRARQQSNMQRLAYKAQVVIEETLDSDFPQLAFAAAVKVLEGTGVLDKRGVLGTIDDAKARHLRSTDELTLFLSGPGRFEWPPPEPISPPEPRKRSRRPRSAGLSHPASSIR